MKLFLVLYGRPATKKNHQSLVPFYGNRPLKCLHPATLVPAGSVKLHARQSDAYRVYETDCLWQIKRQSRSLKPLPDGIGLNLKALYYLPDRRSWPDIFGLTQATADILQKSGLVPNDRQFISSDGSRIVGIDKQNPRAEIEIEEVIS